MILRSETKKRRDEETIRTTMYIPFWEYQLFMIPMDSEALSSPPYAIPALLDSDRTIDYSLEDGTRMSLDSPTASITNHRFPSFSFTKYQCNSFPSHCDSLRMQSLRFDDPFNNSDDLNPSIQSCLHQVNLEFQSYPSQLPSPRRKDSALSISFLFPDDIKLKASSLPSNTNTINSVDSFSMEEAPSKSTSGILPHGSICNLSSSISQDCESFLPDLPHVFPLTEENEDFPVFDDSFQQCNVPTDNRDSYSSDEDNSGDMTLQKHQKRAKKKWQCSNCDFRNNMKGKQCLNCGNPSPFFPYKKQIEPKISYVAAKKARERVKEPLPSSYPETYTIEDFPYASVTCSQNTHNTTPIHQYCHHMKKGDLRICAKCGTSVTPKWRRSPPPLHLLLCNACGLQYSKLPKDNPAHVISPLEECQGDYCVRARAEGKAIRRRLFNRNIHIPCSK